MLPLKTFLAWASVMASLVSAGLWFWAAWGIRYDSRALGGWGKGEADEGFQKQTRFNAYAAAATGVSAVLQAATLSLPL